MIEVNEVQCCLFAIDIHCMDKTNRKILHMIILCILLVNVRLQYVVLHIPRGELISKMSCPVVFHNGRQFIDDSFKVDPCLFCCLCCYELTAISRCLIQESELNPGLSKTSCSPTNLSVRESILVGFQLIVCCT